MPALPIRVLVVDDSAFMRKMVSEILARDPAICVAGQARDGADALVKLVALQPDVITLDVEMPVLDGFGTLAEIMKRRPTPVLMLSSLTQAGADATLRCLELGAVDVVGKPSGSISLDIDKIAAELIAKVKAAAGARVLSRLTPPIKPSSPPFPGATAPDRREGFAEIGALASGRAVFDNRTASQEDKPAFLHNNPSLRSGAVAPGKGGELVSRDRISVLAIGASTGGPRALQMLIPALPADLGLPIVIVQHMPPGFTASLARRLEQTSPFKAKEAADGDRLRPGQILVAPGGHHLEFDAGGVARLTAEPPIHGVRPAVDITFASLAHLYGAHLMAVLLTGMGKDGARGLKMIQDRGGRTLAEDETTCVVYGMPKAAYELGSVGTLLPLPEIAPAIVRACKE
jgi:two-component system chemotaxis response regulator CheB